MSWNVSLIIPIGPPQHRYMVWRFDFMFTFTMKHLTFLSFSVLCNVTSVFTHTFCQGVAQGRTAVHAAEVVFSRCLDGLRYSMLPPSKLWHEGKSRWWLNRMSEEFRSCSVKLREKKTKERKRRAGRSSWDPSLILHNVSIWLLCERPLIALTPPNFWKNSRFYEFVCPDGVQSVFALRSSVLIISYINTTGRECECEKANINYLQKPGVIFCLSDTFNSPRHAVTQVTEACVWGDLTMKVLEFTLAFVKPLLSLFSCV